MISGSITEEIRDRKGCLLSKGTSLQEFSTQISSLYEADSRERKRRKLPCLCENLLHHRSMHIGQPETASLKLVCQTFVIDPKQGEDGGL